jgi:serine/threonine protein kinase
MIGQMLDHYRIVSRLAKGGMGVVYRARDQVSNRDVAGA